MRPMMQKKFVVGLIFIAMDLTTGCAQPPMEHLDAARKVVEGARAAGATEYAKEDFVALEQLFALTKDELAKQENVLVIFRSYENADNMLMKVVEGGERVAAKATQNKEAAKTAALAMEQQAQHAVASAKELMANASKGKDRAAMKMIQQDLGGLEATVGAVHQLIEKEDYLLAAVQAKAAKENGAAVSLEIQSAIDKANGRKPGSRS